MSGSGKKTAKEKRAVRKAQNTRYRQGKAAAGLRQVTVWVPVEALEQVADLRKIGLVVTDGEIAPLVVKVTKKGKRLAWEVIQRQGTLLEKTE